MRTSHTTWPQQKPLVWPARSFIGTRWRPGRWRPTMTRRGEASRTASGFWSSLVFHDIGVLRGRRVKLVHFHAYLIFQPQHQRSHLQRCKPAMEHLPYDQTRSECNQSRPECCQIQLPPNPRDKRSPSRLPPFVCAGIVWLVSGPSGCSMAPYQFFIRIRPPQELSNSSRVPIKVFIACRSRRNKVSRSSGSLLRTSRRPSTTSFLPSPVRSTVRVSGFGILLN
jgi:hypothetical protein